MSQCKYQRNPGPRTMSLSRKPPETQGNGSGFRKERWVERLGSQPLEEGSLLQVELRTDGASPEVEDARKQWVFCLVSLSIGSKAFKEFQSSKGMVGV